MIQNIDCNVCLERDISLQEHSAASFCISDNNVEQTIDLFVIKKDRWLIHCKIKNIAEFWFATSIQRPPYPSEKHKFWKDMNKIGEQIMGSWMIVGDFNEILESHENGEGGRKFNPRKAKRVIEFMENWKMLDLGSVGPAFIWIKKRMGLAHVKEILDKAIGNIEWRNLFLVAIFFVLIAGGSDLAPILILGSPKYPFLPRPFRFHSMWLRDKNCEEVILNRWAKPKKVNKKILTRLYTS